VGAGAALQIGLHAHGARERRDEAAALALEEEDLGEPNAGAVDLVGDLADVAAQQRDLGGERGGRGAAGHGVGVDAEGGVGVAGAREDGVVRGHEAARPAARAAGGGALHRHGPDAAETAAWRDHRIDRTF
jgi:hypothetical protein